MNGSLRNSSTVCIPRINPRMQGSLSSYIASFSNSVWTMARSNCVPFWKDQILPCFGMDNISGHYAIRGPLVCVCVCSAAQACPTLCDPMACSPPGSSVRRILQAGTLEWVAIPFSRGSSWSQGSNPHFLHLLHCRQILCLGRLEGLLVYMIYIGT